MAYFAELNKEDIVLRVIVIDDSDLILNGIRSELKGISLCKSLFGEDTSWVETSYTGSFRRVYAGIGYHYNKEKDIFIPPPSLYKSSIGEWSCVRTQSPGLYGGDFAFGYSPSEDQYFSQNVTGFKVGVSYTASVKVLTYKDGNLRMQIDAGILLNENISGKGTYSATFTAREIVHDFKIWGEAGTVTAEQVNFKDCEVYETIKTTDSVGLNPPDWI